MSATNNTFAVTGLTCGHCVGAVTDELRALPGVSEVEIDLVAGGVSTVTVTASAPLTEEQVTAAARRSRQLSSREHLTGRPHRQRRQVRRGTSDEHPGQHDRRCRSPHTVSNWSSAA